jgi:hypothetical protein
MAVTRTIAAFARWPEPGRVKTRLAPALPLELACELHRAMLADTLAAVRGARADRRVLMWTGAPSGAQGDAVPEAAGLEWGAQVGADLGERLEAAFGQLAAAGPVVVVGSDAPELTAARLGAALDALDSQDLVLGPTRDGGYYLVGLARPAPGLFRGVRWSTEHALEDTRERAAALGLATAMLEPLADVDTPVDLVALIGRLLEHPGSAPASAAALARFGLLPGS